MSTGGMRGSDFRSGCASHPHPGQGASRATHILPWLVLKHRLLPPVPEGSVPLQHAVNLE